MTQQIPILYGTETGNAEYCADLLADRLRDEGFAAKSTDMEDFDPQDLGNQSMVIVITSTYGNGDAPSNAEELLEHLQNEDLDLTHLRFAVCGLGDTSFSHFAQCGKDFEAAFLRCKAKPMFDRVDCDAHFEPEFEAFADTAVAYLTTHKGALDDTPANDEPVAAANDETHPAKGWSRERPFPAKVIEKRLLSKPGSNKETMHYTFDLTDSGLTFSVGDCFGVHPTNRGVDVEALIAALGGDGDQEVTWQGETCSLRQALERACLQQVTLALVQLLAAHDPAGAAAKAAAAGEEAVTRYIESSHVVDALMGNACSGVQATALLKTLRKLQPRLYSVATSPSRTPEQVGFTIETLRYERNGRTVHGVASCWLADRITEGETVGVYPVKNQSFHFPDDDRPVIMIGPGTGVAPFRGYLEELEATGQRKPTWLFFGHQHQRFDSLYEDDFERWAQGGVLSRADYAWSRDQDHKIYVQDRLREQGEAIWSWLERDAVVFVCGDAQGMAPGVAAAFAEIAQTHGGQADGAAYVASLTEQGRYKTDVY